MKLSKGFIFSFTASVAWAISIVIARIILKNGENAYNITFWNAILQLPYWLFIFNKCKPETKKLVKTDFKILLAMGLISTIGISIVEVFALKYSPAINYSFLIRSVILFTMLFAYIFLGEKITLKKVILATLILGGAYLLTTKGKLISLTLGDMFTLLEAALIAFANNVLGKMATNRMSADLSASASFLIGFIPIILIAFFNHAIAVPQNFILIILLTIFYLLITVFRFRAYQNATATYVTMIFSFTPVIVSLMAVPLLSETLTVIQILGGILIVSAGIAVEKLKI